MSIIHEVRVNDKGKTKMVELTPMKAIRFHCKECVGFQLAEIRVCTSSLCPLYPYRMGRNQSRSTG